LLDVKSNLDNSGLSYVWNSQNVLNKLDIKVFIKQILHDQFIQSWYSDINKSSRGHFYSLHKTDFVLEKYLINLKKCRRIQISKLRCSNVKFLIETGRWTGTPRIERMCVLCNNGSIGDELHYLYICQNEQIQLLGLNLLSLLIILLTHVRIS